MDMDWKLMLFIAGAAAVSAGCLVPARWLPALPNDKLLHFVAYGGLALLAGRMVHSPSASAACMIGLFIVGWGIEGVQRWVPGRHFCWSDIAANTAGILTAALISRAVIGL